MELEGSLKAFSLPEVLQFLSMGKMSGYLHLDRTDDTLVLTIKGGRIVNSSTFKRSLRLGEMLVHRGLLKRRDLEEILSLQKTIESEKKLGELLIERELVTEHDLTETVRLQLEEEIWDLFSWEDGHFRFEHGDETSVTDVLVQIDIEPLLLEGSRRQDEWAKIRRSIPKDSMVLGLVPLPQDFRRTNKFRPAEWKVLAAVNGCLSVNALVNRCSLGRFETCHILNALMTSELLRPVESVQPSVRKDPAGHLAFSPEALTRATALLSSHPAELGGRRFGGLFGSRPKAPEVPSGEEPSFQFVAPISEVSALVTAFTLQAMQQKDFAPKPEETRLLQILWREVLMDHPRADIMRVVDNTIDPTLIEEYILKSEFIPSVQECHEEAIEALLKTLKIVFRMAAQRLGEKTAQKILQSLIDTLSSRTTLQYGRNFNLGERCNRTLGVAA